MAVVIKYEGDTKVSWDISGLVDETVQYVEGDSRGWRIHDDGKEITAQPIVGKAFKYFYDRNKVTHVEVVGELVYWLMYQKQPS